MDMDNLGSAPDIENFDATALDRGDNIVVEEKVEPVPEDKIEDIFENKATEEPADEEPAEEPTDEEPVDEQPRDEKGKFASKEAKIPKARFDEAVGKEREAREAAERRAAELERQLKENAQQVTRTEAIEKIETEISTLEEKHAELLLDGNAKEAAAVMKQIRMAERQIATAEAETRASARIAQTFEAQSFDAVVARLEADHPQFNPESEAYDPDLVELVLSKQQALMRGEGLSPSRAMERAAIGVAERFLKSEPVKEDTKGLAAAKAVEDRKQDQIKKNLEAQKRQPASMKESGIDSDKAGRQNSIDVMSISAEEFAALPESTKSKLRGDYV